MKSAAEKKHGRSARIGLMILKQTAGDLPEAAAITVHLYLPDGREETRQISYNGRESLIRFSGK